MKAALPILLALLGTSCAMFGGLSEEDQTSLDIYRKNANQYYDQASISNRVNDYRRSLDQIDKGLALVPYDYRLKSQRAMCLLMLGKRDPNVLPMAEAAFKEVVRMRSDADQDPRVLLGYGLTLHRRGYVQLTRAQILEDEIKNRDAGDSDDPRARASEHRNKATAYFDNAERQLHKLLEKEDFVGLAHQYLMNLKEHQGDREGAKAHGEDYLLESKRQRDIWDKKYQETMVAGFERKVVLPALSELDRNDILVLQNLSFYYRQDKEYRKSISHIDRMLAIQPNRPIYYYNRGDCYRGLSMDAAAKRDFKKFLGTTALPPEHPKVKSAFEYTYRN